MIINEEARKRMKYLMEYTVPLYRGLDEAGEDEEPQDGGQGAPDMGGDPNAGTMPSMDGGQDVPDMGGDPNAMGGDMPMDDGQGGAEGFDPQVSDDPNAGAMDDGMGAPDMGGEMPMDDGMDTMQPDDEVVDVTELVDGQEEEKERINHLDDKFDKLLKAIGSFEELMRQNDRKIEQLKTEFEKRNPTQIEKLSLHSAKGYPFTEDPAEYWAEKEKTSNYSTEDDENGKKQGQYVITKNDVNGAVDWRNIAKTIESDDFIYNQTLNNLLGL